MKEVWKDIKGYEGLYQVSNLGRVKSLSRLKSRGVNRGVRKVSEKILSPANRCNGYLFVVLYIDGKRKNLSVHRLVAQAFIPNPNNLPQINHKDSNPSNNVVGNLEWCDAKYNNNVEEHRNKIAKSNGRITLQYTIEGVLINEFASTCEASRITGISQANISACCRGKKWVKTAGGFVWKYKNIA